MSKIKVVYLVEPMLGIGPNIDSKLIADVCINNYNDKIDLHIIGDSDNLGISKNSSVNYINLPTWRCDPVTKELMNLDGSPTNDGQKEQRVAIITEAIEKNKPDILLIHNYLSGSPWDKFMDFEALPAIVAARKANPNTKIVSYIIQQIDSFENLNFSEVKHFQKSVYENIDHICLRGDNLELFLESCPYAATFVDKIIPCGYTSQEIPEKSIVSTKNISVSFGGGDFAIDTLKVIIKSARELCQIVNNFNNSTESKLDIYVGPLLARNLPAIEETIKSTDNSDLIKLHINKSANEYLKALCYNTALSISQAGQRTFSDLEMAGCPALIIPRESLGHEMEQLYRARYMESCGRSVTVRETDLNSETIQNAAKLALEIGYTRIGVQLNGQKKLLEYLYNLKSVT